MYKIKCKYCNILFYHRYPQTKFCSKKCQYDGFYKKNGKGKKKIICKICNIEFENSWSHTKTCSKKCRIEYEKKYNEGIKSCYNLPKGTVGCISELIVAVDLMKRGYEVLRSLSPSTSCDLAILKEGKLYRIEVRTGYQKPNGKIQYPMHERDNGRQDIFAVVVKEKVFYVPEKF